jgi:hypothetical protein
MPIQVNVANGSITPAGSSLTAGINFQWLNNGTQVVNLASCATWCTQDTYTVQPNGGTTNATVAANPNLSAWAFRDTGWNAPGMPHIQNPARAGVAEDAAEQAEEQAPEQEVA